MKFITFANMKGGTGKTTVCFNIAGKLAMMGKKVLVCDCDPQCNMSYNFGFDIFHNPEIPLIDEETQEEIMVYTIADIFEDVDTPPEKVVLKNQLEGLENLDIIPSTMYLYGTEEELFLGSDRERRLENYLERHADFFETYDYVFMDSGPNMGIVNRNAFLVSDSIFIILDPDINSARGANVFYELWEKKRKNLRGSRDNIACVIVNNIERTKVSSDLIDYLHVHPIFKDMMIDHAVTHSTRFKEATSQKTVVHMMSAKGSAAKKSQQAAVESVDALVEELLQRGLL